jgi:NADH-quinone oxidoreductase subunit C
MKPILETLVTELRSAFGERVRDVEEFRDDVTVIVEAPAIVDIATFLRDNATCPFPLLEDVFAIDQYRRKERFEVKYHFFSIREKVRIHVKVRVEEKDPVVPSITGVFPAANFGEREAYDMMGVTFDGHPDLRRMYMPESYEYYPLRKDFPLTGVPGSIPLPQR